MRLLSSHCYIFWNTWHNFRDHFPCVSHSTPHRIWQPVTWYCLYGVLATSIGYQHGILSTPPPPPNEKYDVHRNIFDTIILSFTKSTWFHMTKMKSRFALISVVLLDLKISDFGWKNVCFFSCDQAALWMVQSVCLSVTPFSQCSHHCIIMKFSGVITNGRSDVHAKGQGQM